MYTPLDFYLLALGMTVLFLIVFIALVLEINRLTKESESSWDCYCQADDENVKLFLKNNILKFENHRLNKMLKDRRSRTPDEIIGD